MAHRAHAGVGVGVALRSSRFDHGRYRLKARKEEVDMRFLIVLVLTGALGLLGCGSDDGGGAGSGGSGGSGGTAGSGGAGGTGGMNGTEPPQITMVAWAPDGSCSPGVASSYTVTVTDAAVRNG